MKHLGWECPWVAGTMVVCGCFGCSAAPPTGGAPVPLVSPSPSPPSDFHVPRRASLHLVDTQVSGDPTRIVYPEAALKPGARYPVVIFFHGHGMDQTQLTERTGLAALAVAEGWLAASGLLTGRGHWGDDEALRATGRLIQALVDQHQADPKRIYLVGFSMGGGTALLAAGNPFGLPYRVAAVASTQGFTDLAAMTHSEAGGGAYARSIGQAYGGDLDAAEAKAHSPLSQAERLKGLPVYLEHGQADTSVPFSHSQRLADRLRTLGAAPELRLYSGKGHQESTIDGAAIIAFLRGKAAP